jgi:hypothetical protein
MVQLPKSIPFSLFLFLSFTPGFPLQLTLMKMGAGMTEENEIATLPVVARNDISVFSF